MVIDNSTDMLNKVHSGRGEIYAFLCRAFGGIPTDIYGILSEIAVKLELIVANTDNKDIIQGTEGIIKFLETRKALSGKELSDFDAKVLRNYTSIFCLPQSVPADESIYTSIEHTERQEPYNRMKVLFKKYNIKKNKKISENEDFISYELVFMSKLAFDCADFIKNDDKKAYDSYLNEQYDFHKEHFDKWLGNFFGKVTNFGIENDSFYKYLALFARGFVAEDKMVLHDLMEK